MNRVICNCIIISLYSYYVSKIVFMDDEVFISLIQQAILFTHYVLFFIFKHHIFLYSLDLLLFLGFFFCPLFFILYALIFIIPIFSIYYFLVHFYYSLHFSPLLSFPKLPSIPQYISYLEQLPLNHLCLISFNTTFVLLHLWCKLIKAVSSIHRYNYIFSMIRLS